MLDTHYRIIGYSVTLAAHIGNSMMTKSAMTPEVMKDPNLANMKAMEDSFFTVWNIFFQITYASFSLYLDLKSLTDERFAKRKPYMNLRKTIFSAIIYPSGMFIFTAFWTIFLTDRSIVFPEYVDQVISKLGNFIMHGFILFVVLWELVFLPVDKPKSHVNNLIIINALFVCYMSWVFYVNSTRKLWPYPMLSMTDGTIYLYLIFLASHVLILTLYFTQWRLRDIFRNKETMNKKAS